VIIPNRKMVTPPGLTRTTPQNQALID
jgi:Patatin-like phospholipase